MELKTALDSIKSGFELSKKQNERSLSELSTDSPDYRYYEGRLDEINNVFISIHLIEVMAGLRPIEQPTK